MSKKSGKKKVPSPKGRARGSAPIGLPATPGGLDLSHLLDQVRQVQEEVAKAQRSLSERVVEGSAGGGMVRISMRGDHRVAAVEVAPECIDPDDVEMLEDLIVAAVNDALVKLEELAAGVAGAPLASLGSIPGLDAISGPGPTPPRPDPEPGG